ncbi:hypothetical protein BASA83_012057 [Batrachochytrium salamandrivorans]|nr:hypothetical protein BASA83_012057 [Batrachochytrium salamandrivorans]
MRVDTGIILSVLSSSVLAAVIPNYDSHGILLVRRTVNPENMSLLWKRADEKQTGPGPSSSGSGANAGASTSNGKSNPNHSGIDSELKKLDHFLKFIERLYKSRNRMGRNPRQLMTQWRDKRLVQTTVKKVAKVVHGEQAKQSIMMIKKLLTTALESTRTTHELFNNKAKSPLFSVSIPKGKTQEVFTEEMVRIQGLVKGIVKEYLKFVTESINHIIEDPKSFISRINGISRQIGDVCLEIKALYNDEYKKFISIVNPKNNEGNIKVIEEYLSETKKYRSGFNAVTDYIGEDLRTNRLKFKGKVPALFNVDRQKLSSAQE